MNNIITYLQEQGDSGGDTTPISIKAGEKKNITVALPKALIPKVYSIDFRLNSGEVKSNLLNITYIIRGSKANIQSISLDKDFYKNGDNALVSFVYFNSVDSYIKGRYDTSKPEHVFSEVKIKSGSGLSCAKTQSKDLINQTSVKVEFPTSIKSNCYNPSVTITLKDEQGNVLDQKELNIKTTSAETPKSNTLYYLIIIVVLILIIAFFIYKKRKNISSLSPDGSNGNNGVSIGILFLFAISLFSLMPTKIVTAATFGFPGGFPGLKSSTVMCSNSEFYLNAEWGFSVRPTDCYTLTQDIPVVGTYSLSSLHYDYEFSMNQAYRQEDFSLNGTITCGESSYCYGYILKADVTDNYNKRQLQSEAGGTWPVYSWFNNSNPISFNTNCDIFGSCTGDNSPKQIPFSGPYSMSDDGGINFTWYISHYDIKNSKEVYDSNVGSDALYEISRPAPAVTVSVNGSRPAVTIKKGDKATVTWTSHNTTTKCTCTYNGNKSCGSSLPANDGTENSSGFLSDITSSTTVNVHCD